MCFYYLKPNTANTLLLKNIGLFSQLSDHQLDNVSQFFTVKTYARNELILARLDPSDEVFFISTGSVRVTSFSQSGKEASYNEKVAGEMFGELSAIDSAGRAADVIALESCTLLIAARKDFNYLIQNYPSINSQLMASLVSNIRRLTERVFEFTAMDVRRRVLAELYRVCLSQGVQGNALLISPAPTHAEIASRVSTTREAVTRVFNTLENDGIIEKHGQKKLTVHSVSALADAIS